MIISASLPSVRRRVLHTLAIYLAASWVVLQVVETLSSLVALPSWVGPLAVALVAIGLPIAVAIAIYTSRTGDAPEPEARPRPAGIRPSLGFMALALLLMAMGAALPPAFVRLAASNSEGSRSLAMLPLVAVDQTRDEGFTTGMGAAILASMGKLEGLRVVGASSVRESLERGATAEDVARDLGVSHVLESKVWRQGQRMRVTARIYARKADSWIWEKDFDLPVDRVHEVPALLVREVAPRLGVVLGEDVKGRITRLPTHSAEAYDHYLRATALTLSRSTEAHGVAIDLLRQAIALDPKFALAHAHLARVFGTYREQLGGPPNHVDSAYTHALRALTLDPLEPAAHAALGATHMLFGRHDAALAALRRSVELNPNDYWIQNVLGSVYAYKGQLDEALPFYLAAAALEPSRAATPLANAATIYLSLGMYDRARATFEQALASDPESGLAIRGLIRIDLLTGRADEAIRVAEEKLNQDRKNPVSWLDAGDAHLASGDIVRANAYFAEARSMSAMAEGYMHYAPILHAHTLRLRGRHAEAARARHEFREFAIAEIELGNENNLLFYGLAAGASMEGDFHNAAIWLGKAIDSGWIYYDDMMQDPVIEDLRRHPDFRVHAERVRTISDSLRLKLRGPDIPG